MFESFIMYLLWIAMTAVGLWIVISGGTGDRSRRPRKIVDSQSSGPATLPRK